MRKSRNRAVESAFTTIAVAGGLLVSLARGSAHAQAWLPGLLDGLRNADHNARVISLQDRQPTRSYYRAARRVNLGALVDQTGTNTHAHWQARLNQDVKRVGVPNSINPRDRDDDGFEDPFDRWPNDPSRR